MSSRSRRCALSSLPNPSPMSHPPFIATSSSSPIFLFLPGLSTRHFSSVSSLFPNPFPATQVIFSTLSAMLSEFNSFCTNEWISSVFKYRRHMRPMLLAKILDGSVALLVARRTNDRRVAGSRPTKVVCITVFTGNRMG